jgi:hypothetical protein
VSLFERSPDEGGIVPDPRRFRVLMTGTTDDADPPVQRGGDASHAVKVLLAF